MIAQEHAISRLGVVLALFLVASCSGGDSSPDSETIPLTLQSSSDLIFATADGAIHHIAGGSDEMTTIVQPEDGCFPAGDELTWSLAGGSGGAFACSAILEDGSGKQIVVYSGSGEKKGSAIVDSEWLPAWSPDGKKLSILSNDASLRVFDEQAVEVARVPIVLAPVRAPGGTGTLWSPDSTRVAYWNSEESALKLLNVDSGKEASPTDIDLRPLAWLTDDELLVAEGRDENGGFNVRLLDIETSELDELADLNLDRDRRSPIWPSPDGQRIVFVRRSSEGLRPVVYDRTGDEWVAPFGISSAGDHLTSSQVWFSSDDRTLFWNDYGTRLYSADLRAMDAQLLVELDASGIRASRDGKSILYSGSAEGLSYIGLQNAGDPQTFRLPAAEPRGGVGISLPVAWLD